MSVASELGQGCCPASAVSASCGRAWPTETMCCAAKAALSKKQMAIGQLDSTTLYATPDPQHAVVICSIGPVVILAMMAQHQNVSVSQRPDTSAVPQVVIMAADAKVLVPLLESRGYTVSVFQAGDID